MVGASWEGFVVENLLAVAPDRAQGISTARVAVPRSTCSSPSPGRRWAVEVKRSLAPRIDRGFHAACADLRPERRFVVYPGNDSYPVGEHLQVVSLLELARLLMERHVE